MRCREVASQLEEYTGQSMTAERREEIDRHLATCAGCREVLRIQRQTSAWMQLTRQRPPAPGPAFWSRLRAGIGERREGAVWSWFPLDVYARRLAYGLSGVALVLGLYVGLSEVPLRPEESALLRLDAPQSNVERVVPLETQGKVDRDQVMVTLVSETELEP